LSVTISGSGTVTSSPAGITCSSGTCTANFNYGSTVTLNGSSTSVTFAGGCSSSGTGTCSITIPAAATAVTAAFCGGQLDAGYCWYMGGGAQSCDTVCSSHGAANAAGTCGYAGDPGNTANCDNVLTALGQAHTGPVITGGIENNGCITAISGVDVQKWAVDAGCLTSAASGSSDWARPCACNN
jgi:hypothetical protein